MATPSANMFSTPDYPGDTPVVLVLLESSAGMLGQWNDARNYFLPILFDALREDYPEAPVGLVHNFAKIRVECSYYRPHFRADTHHLANTYWPL